MKMEAVDTDMLRDEQVIARIVIGETALFEILIRRFNPVLYKIGRMYGFNHQDTQDLMQDTHVAAYTQLRNFEGRSSYKTYVSRIMINKCLYRLKYGYFKNEVPIAVMPESDTAKLYTENNMLNRELASLLEKSLESIPQLYRVVFVLREVEGFSTAETAELLGITEVNVKVRLNRAKVLLQKQLERFYTSADIYSFNLVYCDAMVRNTLEAISQLK